MDSEELELPFHTVVQNIPVSEAKKAQFQNATEYDEQMQQLSAIIKNGWPTNISNVPTALREYWKVNHNLHMSDQLILTKDRLVILASMQNCILQRIHKGHMGIEKCKLRARTCVYCPSMYKAIEQEVQLYPVCVAYSKKSPCCLILFQSDHGRSWEQSTSLKQEKITY